GAVVEGFLLGNYNYDDYKTDPKAKADQFKELTLVTEKLPAATVKKAANEAQILADTINFSRWLGDTPGNLMTPARLAAETQKAAKGTRLKVTVWDKARIKKEKFGGLLGV